MTTAKPFRIDVPDAVLQRIGDKVAGYVWQDMPAGDSGRNAESQANYHTEHKAMVDALHNHPSIVMWVLFNEGWGQYRSEELTEWLRTDVRVTTLYASERNASLIETRLTQAKNPTAVIETAKETIAVGVPEPQREAFRAMIPLGRPGTPDEAARVMLFLAAPLSDYVSGQVIKVTGGW